MFEQYLSINRIRNLKSTTKKSAISELVKSAAKELPGMNYQSLLDAVMAREEMLTTRIAPGLAVPHAQLKNSETTIVALGRSKRGIVYDAKEAEKVHIIVLIISNEKEHLTVLSDIAAKFSNSSFYERVLTAKSKEDIIEIVSKPSIELTHAAEQRKISQSLCRHALTLAKSIDAKAVLVHVDAMDPQDLEPMEFEQGTIIWVTTESVLPCTPKNIRHEIIQVPFRGMNRTNHIEITILVALSKGLIKKGQKAVSVFGMSGSGILDTIVITDVDKEFKMYFSMSDTDHPKDMEQQVFIRSLQLATEIAYEGREGKPVGTLFVIGDYPKVAKHCQQMIVNPFKGYDDGERNILDPGLVETIKEFARIDGAFIIKGDGLIVSAGTYLRVDEPLRNFPPGLGARHAAAAGITAVSESIAIVLSESTRKISLFRSGERIMEV